MSNRTLRVLISIEGIKSILQVRFLLCSSTALKNESLFKKMLSIVNDNRNKMRELTEMDINPSNEGINKYVDEVLGIIKQTRSHENSKLPSELS